MRKQILNKIEQYEIITIFGHIRPDGDCLGSQIALRNIIEDNYKKEAFAVGENSEQLNFLGKTNIVEDDIIQKSLAIIVDTANKKRISDARYKGAKEIIRIDHHHVGSENYGDINLQENSSSCCEIIASMAIENNLTIKEKAATALYTGIVTDTGGFCHKGTNENTLEIASKLIKYGANPSEINKNMSKKTFNKLFLKGYVINNVKKTEKGFVYCYLSISTIEKYEVSQEEASDTLEVLSNIENCPVWALFIEDKEGIRIRIRSNGPRIDFLANKYEGGGHQLASGARIKDLKEIDNFARDVDKVIEEYEK